MEFEDILVQKKHGKEKKNMNFKNALTYFLMNYDFVGSEKRNEKFIVCF